MTCEGCRIVKYCSRECQKSDWKGGGHKVTCKIARKIPADSTLLKLRPPGTCAGEEERAAFVKELLDFDMVFQYAGDHMGNLRHVDLFLPQDKVMQAVFGSGMMLGGSDEREMIHLSARALETFLTRRNLRSFKMVVDDCCFRETRVMTNSGKAFRPLSEHDNLQSFHGSNLVFDRVQDLTCPILSRMNSLKALELDYLTIGPQSLYWSAPGAVQELVLVVSNLAGLVKLGFDDCLFRDGDLERMLRPLVNLRCLSLRGTFGATLPGRSLLTDAGFRAIAENCPSLQSLNLNYHDKATSAGVRAILDRCRHLRELRVLRVRINMQEIPDLLRLAPKLILFSLSMGAEPAPDIRLLYQVTGGKTLFFTEFSGRVDAPQDLPEDIRQELSRTETLVEQIGNKWKDPEVINVWEDLM